MKQFGTRNVGPELGPYCLQRLSADDTGADEQLKYFWLTHELIYPGIVIKTVARNFESFDVNRIQNLRKTSQWRRSNFKLLKRQGKHEKFLIR